MGREQIHLKNTSITKDRVRALAMEYFGDRYTITDSNFMLSTDFFIQNQKGRAIAVVTKNTRRGTTIYFMDTTVSIWLRFIPSPAPAMRGEFRSFLMEVPEFQLDE